MDLSETLVGIRSWSMIGPKKAGSEMLLTLKPGEFFLLIVSFSNEKIQRGLISAHTVGTL